MASKLENKKDTREVKATSFATGAAGSAARLFTEELPPEASPSADHKQLQVAMLWGDTIVNVRHFGDDQRVSVGSARSNHFHVYDAEVGESLTLADCSRSECRLSIPAAAGVALRRGDSQKTREQLSTEGALSGQTLTLQLHDRVQVTVGNVSFTLRWVRPPPPEVTSGTFNFYFAKILTTGVMAGLAVLTAIFMTDVNPESLSEDLFKNPQRFTKLVIQAPEKEPRRAEFNFKKPPEQKAEEKFSSTTNKDTKPGPTLNSIKRASDKMKVMSAGLLGPLSRGDGAVTNLFSPGGLGTGINKALGDLKDSGGISDTSVGGLAGLGSRGTGSGGGGTGLGIGGLGTRGGGRGSLGGYGSINLGGRGKAETRVVPGKTIVTGSCERTLIGKEISRHASEIRYCYETELAKDPTLAGKVAVTFTIDATGAVSDATIGQTTLNNANVEKCVLTRILRWKFPEPKGGGVCVINYPWQLQAAGSGGEDDAG